jgi:hypothetical protein
MVSPEAADVVGDPLHVGTLRVSELGDPGILRVVMATRSAT